MSNIPGVVESIDDSCLRTKANTCATSIR